MGSMMNGFDDVRGSRATTNYNINDGTATSLSNPTKQANQANQAIIRESYNSVRACTST